jgi:hypothetical protein
MLLASRVMNISDPPTVNYMYAERRQKVIGSRDDTRRTRAGGDEKPGQLLDQTRQNQHNALA